MSALRSKSGWFVVLLLSLLPLAFWYSLEPLSVRFSSRITTLLSLGQVTGLVGMAMFALTLVLSGRLGFLEDYFGGLNRVYVAHHVFGSLALVLLLVHPLALAAERSQISARSAALLLLPSTNWAVTWGILALLLMLLLLVLTLFVNFAYHLWKLSHKLLGPAFILASLHLVIINSDVSRDSTLRAYMLLLSAIGILVYLYRTALGRLLVDRFEYRVESVALRGDRVIQIGMTPVRRALRFSAGQFVFVDFRQEGISSEAHPFSITSAPGKKRLEIAVTVIGDYTSRLKELRPGAGARIEGPFGRYSPVRCPSKNQIWIAGGMGKAPFMSMARTLKGSEYGIDIYYGANTEGEATFLDELLRLARSNDRLRVIPFFADVQGFLTAELILELSGDLRDKDILLCGPPPMLKNLTDQFRRYGVKSGRIHSDEFKLR
ncbi:MAG: ferredoxin reductase family protein [Dehalococcoidia bacterium]